MLGAAGAVKAVDKAAAIGRLEADFPRWQGPLDHGAAAENVRGGGAGFMVEEATSLGIRLGQVQLSGTPPARPGFDAMKHVLAGEPRALAEQADAVASCGERGG